MEFDGTFTITDVPAREVRSTGTDLFSKQLCSRCNVLSQVEDPGDVDFERLKETGQHEDPVTLLSEVDTEVIAERALEQEGTYPALLELDVGSVKSGFPTRTSDRTSVALST